MNKPYKIGKSKIHGKGLIATKNLVAGDLIGLSHINNKATFDVGKFHNHSDNANAVNVKIGNERYLIVESPIKKGEEITVNYRLQPDLEQPEDFMNKAQMGGNPFEIPKRDGVRYNPDGSYSTHIMKTETIDGINWVSFPTLFQNEDGSWDNTYELMIKEDPDNWKPAMLEAKRRGELIHFGPNKKAALEFGKGSWKMQGGGALTFSKKLLKKVAKDNRYLPRKKLDNVLTKNFNTGEQLILANVLKNNPNLIQNDMVDLKQLEGLANYDMQISNPRFRQVAVNTDDAGMVTSNWKSLEAHGADFGAYRLPNIMPSQFQYSGYQEGNTFRVPGTNRFTPLNYSFAMPKLFTSPLLPTHHDGLHLIDDKAIGWFRGLSDAQNPNRYIAQEFQMDLGKDRQNTYLAERLDMGSKRPNTLSLGLSGRLENQRINYAQMLRNIDKRTGYDTRTLNDLNSNLSIKQAEYNNKYGLEEYANEIPTLENEIAFLQGRIRELNKKIGEGNIELVTERFKSITDPLQASRIMQSPYMTLHNESLNFLRNKGFNELVIPDAKTITNIQNWPTPRQGTLDLYTRLRNNPMLQQGDPFKFDEYQGTIFNILDKPYKRFKQDGGEEKKMFDWKGYFSGEQGIIPDLYGKSTTDSYIENKDSIQKGADVVAASGLPFISQAANVVSTGIDYGDAAIAYSQGDYDTAKKELAKGTTGFALGMIPGAKIVKGAANTAGEAIVKTGINTATKYGAKSGIKSGVQEAVDTIVDTNTQKKNIGDVAESPDANTMAMMGGEVYRYERSPFKDGKFVISNPADLIIEMTKTEIFTPEFKMGGVVTADGFTLEKMFDNKRKLPYIQYSGDPDIEGRIYYDDTTNEIVDVTTLELRKKRKHNRIKTIIEKYESGKDLSGVEIDALNSLGLLD